MVEKQKKPFEDNQFLETLDDLPMITVPTTMLPNIMDKVMDEHIRDQVKSFTIPAYMVILGLVYVLISMLSPTDLPWMDFLGMLFSSPESGLLNVFHHIFNICWQLISNQLLRTLIIDGIPYFLGATLAAGLVFLGLRVWVKSLHRNEKGSVEQ